MTGTPGAPRAGARGSVTAVCVVHALVPDAGVGGVTAIDKRPVGHPVRVGAYGLRGDVQVSRQHHGGLDKAVYAYSDDAAAHFAAVLGRDVVPGEFGENLRIAGLDVDAARPGERWRIGGGDDALVLEVTSPRTPCQTFARHLGGAHERGWVRRFTAEGRPGAYLRVVTQGLVAVGDVVEVVAVGTGASVGEQLLARGTA